MKAVQCLPYVIMSTLLTVTQSAVRPHVNYCDDIFLCENNECVPKGWRCDHEKDCSDG